MWEERVGAVASRTSIGPVSALVFDWRVGVWSLASSRVTKKVDSVSDLFLFERDLADRGISLVAGVDEAGRGPLAGPVVAAAVILPVEWLKAGLPQMLQGLTDSKQLTRSQRNHFFRALHSLDGVQFGIASVESFEVDQINILQATHRCMATALARLSPGPQHTLVDGKFVPSIQLPQTPIVKGDARSYSIAAASVLAKVTRDRMMEDYHRQWPVYGFAEHKGYGTPEHLKALDKYGPCPIHRRSFGPLRQPELFGATQVNWRAGKSRQE